MAEEEIDNPHQAGFAAANGDAIYRMITGSAPGDLRDVVRILGGTRAVAELTGRSQRTVQRWITGAGQKIGAPRPDAAQALTDAFHEARTTREGRQRIADTRRATLMRSQGAKMRGSAKAGPVSAGGSKAYVKMRTWNHAVGSDVMGAAFDAYIEGGEEAAWTAFNTAFGDEYGDNGAMFDEWMFTDMGGLFFTPDIRPGD